jgi:hypothetical protein
MGESASSGGGRFLAGVLGAKLIGFETTRIIIDKSFGDTRGVAARPSRMRVQAATVLVSLVLRVSIKAEEIALNSSEGKRNALEVEGPRLGGTTI